MAAVLAVTVPAAAGTAGASAAAVASGSLSWTHFNHRTGTGQPAVSNCPAGLNCTRTFLGYTTGIGANPPPPGASNGAAASAPASGPVVTPASAFSANVASPAAYTWVFPTPATGAGTFDPVTRAADAEFRGTLTFNAHGSTFFTFTNPRIVLNGGTPDGTDGQIFASGQNTGEMGGTAPPPSYDRSAHVHDLDLRGATTTTNADGSLTITGIVPNLNLAAFAGLAGFGQGSDRAPNSQGSFAVTLSASATPPPPVGGGPGGGPGGGTPPPGASGSGGNASIGGSTTIALQGAALRGLRSRGVRIAGSRGARVSARSLGLPISGGTVAGWASLRHSGELTLRAGRRSVRLRAFRTTLRSRSVFISAAIGKRRVTVFASRPRRGAVRAVAAAESINLRATPVTLTAAGARAIRRALGLRSLAAGKLGVLTISARPGGAGTTNRLTRPAGAVDLASARVTWHVRESFIRYVGTGEGTSVSAGATADPPVVIPPTDVPLSYVFHYPFASGWHDGSSRKALVNGSGAVTFSFAERGISIAASNPEIVLDGRRSHASFILRGSAGDRLTGRRVVLMNLDPAKAASSTTSPDGKTITYDRIPGTIPQGTQTSVFAGFYVPGEAFGSISISLTRR